MRMNELAARIIGWGNDRNLIKGSTPEKQHEKLVEEWGEYAAGKARGKLPVQRDALGDVLVIGFIMAEQLDQSAELLDILVSETAAVDRNYDAVCGAIQSNVDAKGRLGIDKAFLLSSINFGDLAAAFFYEQRGDIINRLAFVMGGVIAMCVEHDWEPAEVLEDVWNIIKDRKGRMVDGVFIKENDSMMAGDGNKQ